MHLFIRAAITKYHKHKFIILQFWRLEVRDEAGWFLLRAGKENLLPASLLASGGFLAIFGITWFVNASPLHLYIVFSLCVYLCLNFPSYKDISNIGLGPTIITSF